MDSALRQIFMIRAEYIYPPADLSPFISTYYLFETDEADFSDIEHADAPQIRVFLKGSGTFHFPDGNQYPNFPVSLHGPRMGASSIHLKGPVRVFGFGVLPAGWSALTKLSAAEYTHRIVDPSAILRMNMENIMSLFANVGTFVEMAEIVNRLARGFEARAEKVPYWFIRAVDEWLEQELSPDISDLERKTGLSRKQIEKMTKQIYGASPKLLQRRHRALRTANAIANGDGDWQDFIGEAYYDQSHCIHEMKEFIGITPGAIKEYPLHFSTLILGRSKLTTSWPFETDLNYNY